MKEYLDVIKRCPLFAGIGEDDLFTLLDCLSAKKRSYTKNEFVFMAGDKVSSIGIVLSGVVHVIKEDFWGTRTIIAAAESGELFGEAFSCSETERLHVSVVAVQPADILFVDYRRIATMCSASCTFHSGLITNMLHILAEKNVMMTQKMELLTRRTTREKLLAYLSMQAKQAGGGIFEIPFNRQELAEYLSVDRSAMSNELSKMRDDGILNFNRNQFELFRAD